MTKDTNEALNAEITEVKRTITDKETLSAQLQELKEGIKALETLDPTVKALFANAVDK